MGADRHSEYLHCPTNSEAGTMISVPDEGCRVERQMVQILIFY